MDNAGVYTLAALQIGAPLECMLSPISCLEGMTSVTLDVTFLYGSGGSACSAIVVSTMDRIHWRHIARFDFTTASAVKNCTVSIDVIGVTDYSDLAVEGTNSIPALGNELAVYISSSGKYSNTVLSVRAAVRDGIAPISLSPPPAGFIYLLGADGALLTGADGALLLGLAS